MNKYLLEDEISAIVENYAKFTQKYMHPQFLSGISKKGRFLYDNFVVISDNNPLGKIMLPVFEQLRRKNLISSVSAYSVFDGLDSFEDFDYSECSIADINELEKAPVLNKCAVMLCVDCVKIQSREIWLQTVEKVCNILSKGKDNMCIVSLMLPEYPAIPDDNIKSLSEREFSYFIEEVLENPTPEQSFFIEFEAVCRKIVNNGFCSINVSRIDNLFGPASNMIRTFDIDKCIKDTFDNGVMEITSADYENQISCTYIRDAVNFAIQILYSGRKGQIYNFCSYNTDIANIKATLREGFKNKISLNVKSEKNEKISYRCINTLKLFQSGWNISKSVPFSDAVYKTVCEVAREEHNNEKNIEIYSGKLNRIKDLELMMLKDIDELCQKNGIKYFLCGGTMLGAVRYGHSIPWDDDLDIGMLRKDFDKFRKVSMEQQKPLYNYSSHWNKSGSHYIVDKVRLNSTYFSTRYSSIHEYPDGLFIDVLVYDQTSNNRIIGKIHSNIVHVLSKIIEVRWYNRPRKNPNHRLEMLILPVLRILPLNFYHKLYEFVLTIFKNKKNAKYVIDSTGKLQKKGPFLMYGLEDVKRVDFDGGFKAPIPFDCTNYLTFDYGPNYLPEPPLSKRAAPHNFARIDLGEFIFKTSTEEKWRRVDVRGELYEKEV